MNNFGPFSPSGNIKGQQPTRRPIRKAPAPGPPPEMNRPKSIAIVQHHYHHNQESDIIYDMPEEDENIISLSADDLSDIHSSEGNFSDGKDAEPLYSNVKKEMMSQELRMQSSNVRAAETATSEPTRGHRKVNSLDRPVRPPRALDFTQQQQIQQQIKESSGTASLDRRTPIKPLPSEPELNNDMMQMSSDEDHNGSLKENRTPLRPPLPSQENLEKNSVLRGSVGKSGTSGSDSKVKTPSSKVVQPTTIVIPEDNGNVHEAKPTSNEPRSNPEKQGPVTPTKNVPKPPVPKKPGHIESESELTRL